jgi:hypothetical protein
MLQPMSPVDEQVAEQYDFHRLQPPRLRTHRLAKPQRHHTIEPSPKQMQYRQHGSAPKQILAHKKQQISRPVGTQHRLRFRRIQLFHWSEQQNQKQKTRAGAEH